MIGVILDIMQKNDGANKNLKLHAGGGSDSFRYIFGTELIENCIIINIAAGNLFVRGTIQALKSWGNVKSNGFDTCDNDHCIFKKNS